MRWLEKYAQDLKAGGNLLMLWGVSDGVMKALDDSKVIATIGRDNVFAVQPEIGASTGAALEAADAWIDAHRSTVTPDRDAPSESTRDEGI